MPGATLQRACRLLVAVCALHLGVTLVYYLSGRDLSRLPQLVGVSSTLQGGTNSAAASKQPPGEHRPPGARPPSPLGVSPKPRPGPDSSPDAASGPGLKSNLTSVAEPTTTGLLSLPACPEESPLLERKAGETMFNRAKLLNIGFQEALKDYDYNCFVFSDVDLIPMDDHNAYRCFSQPRHISVAMDKFGYSLPYVQYFGGVSALSKQQFLAINGFPNNYWGWGGEDDDIFNRLVHKGMSISRPNAVVGKCRMIRHSRDKKNEPNPQRFDRIAHTKETMRFDGLNSLTYQVLDVQRYPLYTKITVDIGTPR
ncbi:Beta-1,4-galactosyltransferase 1 [Apodemus speciosus]|uniref:Beta-1,4-galactosyltransferase n=1 Tax=Apodemus speciosus TaxID=105296 RepID=A0ABQ0EMU6_APOSI